MNEVVVIIGAGASHDCANAGGVANEAWKPPLARELFDIAKKNAYESILNNCPGARALAADLAELSQESSFNLEEELTRLSNHSREHTRRQFEDIPRYLRQLLWQVSNRYVSNPGGHIRLFRRLTEDTSHSVTFVSLNYDTLLEQALQIHDSRLRFVDLPSYLRSGLALIKPHGCITWFVRMRPHVDEYGNKSMRLPAKPWDIEMSDSERLDNGCYPVVTAPLADKLDEHIVCPPDQRERMIEACSTATKFLFIGTSAWDAHLLSLIGAAAPAQIIHVVTPDDAHAVTARVRSHFTFWNKMGTGPICKQIDLGFRQYLRSEEFRAFCLL